VVGGHGGEGGGEEERGRRKRGEAGTHGTKRDACVGEGRSREQKSKVWWGERGEEGGLFIYFAQLEDPSWRGENRKKIV